MHNLTVLALAALVAVAYSQAGLAQAADSDAGRQAYQSCMTCHGERGEGKPEMNAPALAGQQASYLIRQLQHFSQGLRGADPRDTHGQQMRPMVAVIAEGEAIEQVANYLAGLKAAQPPAAPQLPDTNLRNGEVQYNSACGACHGDAAQGNELLHSPRLSGLDLAYLRRQMDNFKEGLRGTHADDKYGRQMAMMATTLSKAEDLRDVLAFIQSRAAD